MEITAFRILIVCFISFYVLCMVEMSSSSEVPAVLTQVGEIKGVYKDVLFKDSAFTVKRFLGIPFAEPPVGDLRFKKPKPLTELPTTPFLANEFGPACAQVDIFNTKVAEDSSNEDCLFMNVFVPDQKPERETGHAVMVFIHGGAFSLLTGSRFISDRLASVGNVIVVTFNYRLWIWGFLNIGDERAPGNMGLWDQQIALKWVHENIGAFGGDKERVTIFGESAGAISVGLQALYPENKGLFQNVITQSGTPTLMRLVDVIHDNVHIAKLLAKVLGCNTEDNDAVFKCIQEADSKKLIEAFGRASSDGIDSMELLFTPTVDGDFMKRSPVEFLELANTNTLAEVEFLRSLGYMNGVNSNEGTMWLNLIDGPKESYDDLTLSKHIFDNFIIPSMLPLVVGTGTQCSDVLKSLVSFQYTDWQDPTESRKEFVKFTGDLYYNVPAIEFSRLHANSSSSNSFLYKMSAQVERHILPTPDWIGSGNHGDILGPVFGYDIEYEFFDKIKEKYSPSKEALDLSERVMTMWTNFAKYSNPNGEKEEKWPNYKIGNEQFLNIDTEDSVGAYLYAENFEFWREIIPRIVENCHDEVSTSSETCDADEGCS